MIAGLYKQLASLRELLQEYREGPAAMQQAHSAAAAPGPSHTQQGQAEAERAASGALASTSGAFATPPSPRSSSVAEDASSPASAAPSFISAIIDLTLAIGLQRDCPFTDPVSGVVRGMDDPLQAEEAEALPAGVFAEYASRLYAYLQVRTSHCLWLFGLVCSFIN